MNHQHGTAKSTTTGLCPFQWPAALVLLSLLGLVTTPAACADDDYEGSELARMPASVGALGDSMSAAALAGYKRQESIFPWVQLGLLANALQYGATKDIHSIEHRKYSWTTGSSIPVMSMPSHLKRLNEIAGKTLPYFNAALSGAESDHVLNTQIGDLRTWSRENLNQEFPDYVTLLIGANDLCARTTDEMIETKDFYSHVSDAVHEIMRSSPNTRILVSSLPNVVALRDVAKDSKVFGAVSCEIVWKKAKLCSTLTSLDDPESRLIVKNRLEEYNRALYEITQHERERFGDRVRYAKHLSEADFTAKDLAVDCFHPNKVGQAKVAEKTFASSWWKDQWSVKRAELKSKFLAEQKRDCPPPGPKGAYRPQICYETWTDPE